MNGLQIRDPEAAIAIGRCVTARSLGAPTASHEVACGWEDYPTDVLVAALRDFVAWAGFDDRSNTTERHATRTFAELSRERQRELVTAAQAFPEPIQPTEPPPPDAPMEDPEWMRA